MIARSVLNISGRFSLVFAARRVYHRAGRHPGRHREHALRRRFEAAARKVTQSKVPYLHIGMPTRKSAYGILAGKFRGMVDCEHLAGEPQALRMCIQLV